MPIVIAPQYQDPQISKIVSNLGTAIYGDPEARMKGAYYGSEVDRNNATTRKTNIEADRGAVSLGAYRDLPTTLKNLYQVIPGEDPVARQNRISTGLGALVQAGAPTSTSDDIAKAGGSALSSIYTSGGAATGNNDQMRGGMALGGHNTDEDYSGTDKQAKIVSDRKAKAKVAEGVAVAGVNQAGENQRFFGAPIKTGAGEVTQLSPTDPRYGKMGDKNGTLTGLSTKATVEGAAGEKIAAGNTDPTLANLYYGSDKGANGRPRSVLPAVVHKVGVLALGKIAGVNDPDSANAFNSFFGPEKISAAEDAGAEEMARSGNADHAATAYLGALGLKPGDTFNNPGRLGRLFLGHEQGITPAAAQVAAAPVAAAPANVHPAQIPPAQRQLGMVVQSPRGPLVWTRDAQGNLGWAMQGQH